MDYERFKEGFQDALKAELAVRGADVELTARRVDKMNDSYDAITVRPVDSSIGVNISVEKAFAAYENGTPIPEIAEHFSDAVEKFGKPLAEYRNFRTGTNGKVYA